VSGSSPSTRAHKRQGGRGRYKVGREQEKSKIKKGKRKKKGQYRQFAVFFLIRRSYFTKCSSKTASTPPTELLHHPKQKKMLH